MDPVSKAPNAVEFGFKLPNCAGVICRPEWAEPTTIEQLATHAAASGYSSLWLHDHLLVPAELSQIEEPNFFEPMILLARLAALVPDVTLGVATLVLPLREPVLLSKQIATLEAFFPGRFVIGVGSGRYESEFRAFGSDEFDIRGGVAREHLRVLRALEAPGPVDFDDGARRLTGAIAYPKTAPGLPPIWSAGMVDAALRGAATLADGWVPAALPPQELRQKRDVLFEYVEAAERDPAELTIALSATLRRPGGDGAAEPKLHRHKTAFVGEAEQVAEQLHAYVDEGVSVFLVSFDAPSVPALVEHMDWCAREVIPLVESSRPERTIA